MVTGPKYVPYTYMDPLGLWLSDSDLRFGSEVIIPKGLCRYMVHA